MKPKEGSKLEESKETPAFEKKEDLGKKKTPAEVKAERHTSLTALWDTASKKQATKTAAVK